MAVDQVPTMQVVLADGSFITATSKQNPDVFWMLRGGCRSTIGVVTLRIPSLYLRFPEASDTSSFYLRNAADYPPWSLTINAYLKLQTTTVSFNFTLVDTPGPAAFWAAVQAYIDNMENFVDAGTYGYYFLGASVHEIGPDYPGMLYLPFNLAVIR